MLAMPSMPSPPLLAPMAPATCSPRPPLAGRPRPNMILPLAKVFNVAASQDHDAPQIRDFYGLAFKGNNPHETQFHMQARLGFRRPKPQGIRLRPVQRGCSTKEVVLERHRNRKAAKAAKAAQAVAKADERRTALALHAQKASSKGFERGTTKAADPMAMSFASSFGRPTTALEPGESDQNYGQVSYDMVGAAVQEALDEDDASDLEDGSIVEMQTPLTNPKMAQSKSQPKGRQKTAEEKELEEAEWDDDHVNAATKLQAKLRGNATRKQVLTSKSSTVRPEGSQLQHSIRPPSGPKPATPPRPGLASRPSAPLSTGDVSVHVDDVATLQRQARESLPNAHPAGSCPFQQAKELLEDARSDGRLAEALRSLPEHHLEVPAISSEELAAGSALAGLTADEKAKVMEALTTPATKKPTPDVKAKASAKKQAKELLEDARSDGRLAEALRSLPGTCLSKVDRLEVKHGPASSHAAT